MSSISKPTCIDFDSIDSHEIQRILKTGNVDTLSEGERQYYNLMELVRGLRARMQLPGGKRIVTKSGIIKLLKGEPYCLSDWMARRVYSDSLNFFYSDSSVTPQAWSNYYAERLDKLADLAIATGRLKEARAYITEAAKLRGCYDQQAAEIPVELLEQAPCLVYTTDAESMGAPKVDRKLLEAKIDAIPDIPEVRRERIKADAGIKKRNMLAEMMGDISEYGEEE